MTEAESFCPYQGLDPFGERDREYFVGREDVTEIITANLLTAPLTILYGKSGVGKSSVLLAGVAPAISKRGDALPVVVRDWHGAKSVAQVKEAILGALGKSGVVALPDPGLPFDELLRVSTLAARSPIALIFDQFEEYCIYHPATLDADGFDADLARAINRRDISATFLFSMREDSLSLLDRFKPRIPHLLGNPLRLDPLSTEGALRAVREPLERYRRDPRAQPGAPTEVEADLVNEIVEEVKVGRVVLGLKGESAPTAVPRPAVNDETVEAPFLQLVLTRLWQEELKLGSAVLRSTTFETLGRAKKIVQRHLTDAMDELGPRQQALCVRFFDRLVTPSSTKVACRQGDLVAWSSAGEDEVTAILEHLRLRRILRVVQAPGDRQPSYEIFHDVLAPAVLAWRAEHVTAEQLRALRGQLDEQRRHVSELRRWRAFLGAALVALVAAFITGCVLWVQTKHAHATVALINRKLDSELGLSQANLLVRSALAQIDADPELSFLLARKAANDAPGDRLATDALTQALSISRLVRTIPVTRTRASAVAWSQEDRIVVAAEDGSIGAWATGSGKWLWTSSGKAAVTRLIVGKNDRLMTYGRDHQLRVRGVDGGELQEPAPLSDSVEDVAFSPKQTIIAFGFSRQVVVMKPGSTKVRVLGSHDGRVIHLAFDEDETLLASTDSRNVVKVWSLKSGKIVLQKQGEHPINAVALAPDGSEVAFDDGDLVRVFSVNSAERAGHQERARELVGHTATVSAIAFGPRGRGSRVIATAALDRTAKVWDVKTGRELFTLAGHGEAISHVVFSPDGRQLLTASLDGTARIWNVVSALEVGWAEDTSGPTDATLNLDGSYIVTNGGAGIAIWRAETGALVNRLPVTGGIAFSKDGKDLLVVGSTGDVEVLDFPSLAVRKTSRCLAVAGADFTQFTHSPNFGLIAAWRQGGTEVVSCDPRAGRQVDHIDHPGVILLSLSPDATSAMLQDSSGLSLVRFPSLKPIATLLPARETHGVKFAIDIDPDGKSAVIGQDNGSFTRWDLTQHRKVHEFPKRPGVLNEASFSDDGRLLATCHSDGTVRVWQAHDLAPLLTIRVSASSCMEVRFDGLADKLVALTQDGTAHVIRLDILDSERLLQVANGRPVRALTGTECQEFLGLSACTGPNGPSEGPRLSSREN